MSNLPPPEPGKEPEKQEEFKIVRTELRKKWEKTNKMITQERQML